MPIRMTVDIPKPLHDELRRRAQKAGTSIRALIIRAIEDSYGDRKEGEFVTGSMVQGSGKLGPAFPTDENPHDLVSS